MSRKITAPKITVTLHDAFVWSESTTKGIPAGGKRYVTIHLNKDLRYDGYVPVASADEDPLVTARKAIESACNKTGDSQS